MDALYNEIREALNEMPVVETHTHYTSVEDSHQDCLPIILGYLKSDMRVCAGPCDGDLILRMIDPSVPFQRRFELFDHYYQKCRHTAYAKAMLKGLEICWDIHDVSYTSLCELNERLSERTNEFMFSVLRKANVRAQVADIFESRFFNIMKGDDKAYGSVSHFAFPLPAFHRLYTQDALEKISLLTNHYPDSLDDYVHSVGSLMEQARKWGAVCVKDQSAYFRTLNYGHPTHAEAEAAFNHLLSRPMQPLGAADGKALDDYLMQAWLSKAGKLGMPVQLHTGLQDRIALQIDRNGGDIRDVNATLLIPTMERHRTVRFDLFHANWPYMDELLYIGKNFPNATLDLCWAHNIDPFYSIELMVRAATCLPDSKILAFGGDAFFFENGIGYLAMARDNIALAMTRLIRSGWLNRDNALELAQKWLYDNPVEYYGLKMEG